MKKILLALLILLVALALIFTACKATVPDDEAIKGKGDSIVDLSMKIDCTLQMILDNGRETSEGTSKELIKSITGKGDGKTLIIRPLYSRTLNLIQVFKNIERENAILKMKKNPETPTNTRLPRTRH
jgi:hypothetical protein